GISPGGGSFDTRQLSDEFHAEGAAFGDINKDGTSDIVYGPFWFEGPEFDKRHLIYKPNRFAIATYSNNFMPYVEDLDGDGWDDVLVLGFPGRAKSTYWYQNPGETGGAWQQHIVSGGPGNESPAWTDVDGDGKKEIVCSTKGQFVLIRPDSKEPQQAWQATPITPPGSTGGHFTHGLGIGDVDGDGKMDLLEKNGWWQQGAAGEMWKKHSYPFSGAGGAQMFAYDFDGDGDNDIVTSLAAHGYGLAWYENVGETFERHVIMGSRPDDSDYGIVFSQLHGMELADVDGDGVKDLITGKRYWAHGGKDPGGIDKPVIYWFRTVRGGKAGVVDFVPHLIDADSGVGTVVTAGDINGDGRLDVLIGNKKGCYVHLQNSKPARALAKVARKPRTEIEGESMQIIAAKGSAIPQPMGAFGGEWSGASQLWWTGGKPGDTLKLAVPVDAAGEFELTAALATAVDYGIVQLSLDGKKLGAPIDCFQAKGVGHTGEIELGRVELKEGEHVLEVKITGANADAIKAYMFGLDFIRLKEAVGEPQAQASPRTGSSPPGKNLGFEKGTLEGWEVTGDVWKGMPIQGDTVRRRRAAQSSQHDGDWWIGGYERKQIDDEQGTLTSTPFEVTHPWASFLVGGGSDKSTRVELLEAASEKVVFSASGSETENMEPVFFDISKHLGKQIRVRVVDESSALWGHINYDDLRFHDSRPIVRPGRVVSNPLLQHLLPNPVGADADPSVAAMQVPEGFQVNLIAKQPTVTQPIAFTFDARGRIWIAEAHSYPLRQAEGEGRDRIIILEDTEGDGTFKKKTTFATGLNLVSGLEVGFGGVWVGAAPQLLFIPDKDRDDVPDSDPVVLLDGWGYADTHETLNSFIWGPDGYLYGNQGVFNHSKIGKPGAPPEERIEMRAGVWRYHPQRHEFEIFATGGSNQWGIDFDEMGHMFITHCRSAWGGGPTSYVVRNGHYWNQSNSHHAPFVSAGTPGFNPGGGDEFRNFLLSSARYGHGEGGAGKPGSRALYGGHSHVGTMIYLGNNWPQEYRNQLFTHNLHGHQMNRQINQRQGSGFNTVHAGSDQLLTPDPRFIGVDLKYGPDGAVYMIDWHDKQHCHTNNTEAWERSDGRLYRMAWKETYQPVTIDLRKKSLPELMKLALSKDEWLSRTARRLLQESGSGTKEGDWPSRGPQTELFNLVGQQEVEPATALRAIWALHALGAGTPHLALSHSDENVRAAAVHLRTELTIPAGRLLQLAKSDPSAMVRLAIASTLPDLNNREAAWAIIETLATKHEDDQDPYLPKMIWYAMAELTLADPARAVRLAKTTPMPVLSDSIFWYLGRSAAGRDQIVQVLRAPGRVDDARVLQLMASSLPSKGQLPMPPGWQGLSARLRSPTTTAALDKLNGLFGDISVMRDKRSMLVDLGAAKQDRQQALNFLKDAGDLGCAPEFIALMKEPEFRTQVLPLMARFDDEQVAAAVLAELPGLQDADLNAAIAALSSQPLLAKALLTQIKNGDAESALLTSLHVRQMQSLGNRTVDRLLSEVWGKAKESGADAKASIAKYKKLYTAAPLWSFDRSAGAIVFTKTCAICHTKDGAGKHLGPDLSGSHSSGLDYFLESIIDPNAVIGETFQLNVITKKDGSVISGMPADEDDVTLTVQTLTETVQVPKSEIKSRQVMEQSMMPPGILGALSEKEVIELLQYLTTE
ncbi:MAG: putative membrane-bound dehydrogenase-like protein, partial [Verrucomicrobiales bacterium]